MWSIYKVIHANQIVKENHNSPTQFVEFDEKQMLLLYTFAEAIVTMNRIKDLRVQTGMKQTDLAKLMNCAPTTISNYEVELRDIDSATICRLVEIFGCSADYLLGLSSLQKPELSEMEESILCAWRKADDHVRDLVRLALDPFWEDERSAQVG